MLEYYGLPDHYEGIKDWYDGYLFGNADVFCPWDVINQVDILRECPTESYKNHWINTSSNALLSDFISEHGLEEPGEIESLVAGKTVTKPVHLELDYRDLSEHMEHSPIGCALRAPGERVGRDSLRSSRQFQNYVWTLLFATGYLTVAEHPEGEDFNLRIPNREIRDIFVSRIKEMFIRGAKKDGVRLTALGDAVRRGDAGEVEKLFTEYLKDAISIRDTSVKKEMKENFYHGYLLGLLQGVRGAYAMSNREGGEGFADIIVEFSRNEVAVIIEMKYAETEDLAAECERALKQIEERGYEQGIDREDYPTVIKLGIACRKKKCKVVRAG